MSPISEFVAAALVWIASVSGYTIDSTQEVVIEYRSYTELAALYHGVESPEELVDKTAIPAALHSKGKIYLPHSFDVTDLVDQSTLVHELFHVIQYQNGQMELRCAGKIESEAYGVENQWRTLHGLDLIPQNEILLIEMMRCPPQRHLSRIAWIKEKRGRHANSQ